MGTVRETGNDAWSCVFFKGKSGHTRESGKDKDPDRCVQSPLVKNREETFFMQANQRMRVILKAYDHQLIDAAAKKIVDSVKKNGGAVSGPVPLPTKREVVTILRAVHKYKDSREQFEQRTHKRLIAVINPSSKITESLRKMDLPAGVYVEIKMK